MARNWHRFY